MNTVNNWFAWLAAWARSKNITTHTIGAGIVTAALAYDSSPDLRNYIGTLFAGYPVVVTHVGVLCANIGAGVALWRNFSHSSSAAGTLATARAIVDDPKILTPTTAQVDAADTTIKP